MELTKEQSDQQAEIIRSIALLIFGLDVQYCREAAESMIKQAHRQESMAVLNPSHSLIKNDILRAKGQALNKLCDYVDKLKEIDELQMDLKKESQNKDLINSMFM